jgi:hypothetical protein
MVMLEITDEVHALLALGFTLRGTGELRPPSTARIRLFPTNYGLEIKILLSNGSTVTAITKTALRINQ